MMNKAKLSVYILAYNEEEKIEDCVKSATWADEVVVIDSHSTDKTAEIAESLGAKVVQVDFEGFGKIRMSGIEHTQSSHGSCQLMQTKDLLKKLGGKWRKSLTPRMPRMHTTSPSKSLHGKKNQVLRMVSELQATPIVSKRKMTYEAKDLVHEDYIVNGSKGYLSNSIIQIPFLGLSEVLQKMDRYSELGAGKLLAKQKKCPVQTQYFLKKLVDFRQDLLSSPRVSWMVGPGSSSHFPIWRAPSIGMPNIGSSKESSSKSRAHF